MFGNSKAVWNVSTVSMMVVSFLFAVGDAKADYVFGEPVNLGPVVNSAAHEAASGIMPDELTIYYDSNRSGGQGSFDIWMTTRASISDPWESPENVTSINSQYWDGGACISADGLELYFTSNRPGAYSIYDLWVAERETINDPWGVPVNLGETINASGVWVSSISSDGLELYFGADHRPGGHGNADIWVVKRPTREEEWGTPTNLGAAINSPANEIAATTSSDGLLLLFTVQNGGNISTRDIWVSRRTSKDEPWQTPIKIGAPINTATMDLYAMLSSDGKTLYFATSSGTYGGLDMWQAPVLPVVDFTGDYRVDIADLVILIEHWGQNEPAYDMGPMPWGDGIIDAADLEVLMSHWGQELDPNLLAYWKLDEAGGDFVHDSAAENHAAVMGDALWQPEGGQVDGALQLDGVDDYLAARFILDPVKQPFSAFAWIKGGQPGQTIISQKGGFGAWLSVDSAGALTCGLTFPMPAVTSNVVVTDDQWHRVGLVSDGAGMSLYVDNVEVARTPTSPILPANGDLQIGAGKNLEPDAFWEGLIDDVRVYDRVVVP